MRGNQLAVLALIALVAKDSKGFTPYSLSLVPPSQSTTCSSRGSRATRLYASTSESGTKEEIAFPYDDGEVRYAYDEWRVMHGKGPYNESRFHIYKENYKTLTLANLQAKKEAKAAGRPAPEWQSLNEFGDISLSEYEAYKNGAPLPTTTATPAAEGSRPTMLNEKPQADLSHSAPSSHQGRASSTNSQASFEYTPNGEVNKDAQVQASYADCRQAYVNWCKKYGKEEDATRFATFSSNYLAMSEYVKNTGRLLKLNKYADCTKEEYDQILDGSHEEQLQASQDSRSAELKATQDVVEQQKMEQTPQTTTLDGGSSAMSSGGSPATEYQDQYGRTIRGTPRKTVLVEDGPADSSSARPTQVIQRGDQSFQSTTQSSGRPTQVVQRATSEQPQPSDSSSGRPTLVIPSSTNQTPAAGGTQVIQSADTSSDGARGTQVIQRAGQPNPTAGTQVIQRAGQPNPTAGTQVIQRAGQPTPTTGTQVIQRAGQPTPTAGTQVIQRAGQPNPTAGTQVIQRAGQSTPAAGTQVIQRAGQSTPAAGTQVIQRAGQPNPTTGTQVIQRAGQPNPNAGTQVIQRAGQPNPTAGTQVIQRAGQPNPTAGTQVIPRAGQPNPTAGTQVIQRAGQPNPTAGTQVIQRAGQSTPAAGTQVIQRAGQPNPTAGTQVIQRAERPTPAAGTQVIQRAGQPAYFSGTQVIPRAGQPNPTAGTQVIQRAGQSNPTAGTQVIQRADKSGSSPFFGTQEIPRTRQPPTAQGTQVIQRAGQSPTSQGTQVIQKSGQSPTQQGTQVIQRAGESPTPQGTRVIQRAGESPVSPIDVDSDGVRGTIVVQRNGNSLDESAPARSSQPGGAARGTIVIQRNKAAGDVIRRSLKEGSDVFRFPFLGGGESTEESDPRSDLSGRGTIVIKRQFRELEAENPVASFVSKGKLTPLPGDDRPTIRPTQVVSRGSDTSTKFSPASSIMSLFGGTRNSVDDSRPVRGTVQIQRPASLSDQPSPGGRKKTVIIDKPEPIFNFFGGSKKQESNDPAAGRPTIVLQNNGNTELQEAVGEAPSVPVS